MLIFHQGKKSLNWQRNKKLLNPLENLDTPFGKILINFTSNNISIRNWSEIFYCFIKIAKLDDSIFLYSRVVKFWEEFKSQRSKFLVSLLMRKNLYKKFWKFFRFSIYHHIYNFFGAYYNLYYLNSYWYIYNFFNSYKSIRIYF